MKKISRKNLLFLTFSFSVLISGAIAIPLGIQARSKTFDAELQSYNEKLEGAINLSNQQNFDQNEFVRIAKNLKIKNEFVSKFSVKDAIDLHFDKFYSFDLNDIVDFSPILAKFPDFKVKLVLPSKKEQVKIEGNSLKNLAINIVNTQKSVNFSTQIDLKFDSSAKKIDIKPENLKLIFKLSNNELTKNKSAVELAIALQKNFSENFKKNKDQVKALFKTLPNFGGISVFREGKDQIILPSNFEIKPKLENERLIFSKVDNVHSELELQLSLFDKNTKKETELTLKTTSFPKVNEFYQDKISENFKKSYKFKDNLARVLVFFNISPAKVIFENLPEKLKNHPEFKDKKVSDFSFWYQENSTNTTKKEFLETFKDTVPDNFVPESVKLEFDNKKFGEKELKNFNDKNQIPLVVSIAGKFKDETLIPAGLNLNDKKEFSYKFSFVDNLEDPIYSASLENALNPLDENGKINVNNLKLESLKFEVKQDLPTTVFASTIDQTISHVKNKPLDLKNLDTLQSLFNLLNSSVKLDKNESPVAKKVAVNTTFFANEFKQQKTKFSEQISGNSKKPGDILRETFERLAKTPMLEKKAVFLSSEFSDKYNLVLNIKDGNETEKTLKFPIDSVKADNKAYELLQKETNLHLFLDWRTNIETESKIQKPFDDARNYVKSISSINNSGLKFVPVKPPENSQPQESNTEENVPIFPFQSKTNKGILLTNHGLKLEKTAGNQNSKNLKNITIYYVFKPTLAFYPYWDKYFLLRSSKDTESTLRSRRSTSAKTENLDLIIKNYLVPGFNLVIADFRGKPVETIQEHVMNAIGNEPGQVLMRPTFNGDIVMDFHPNFERNHEFQVDPIKIGNNRVWAQDFLNNPSSTVMLKLKIEPKGEEKHSVKLSFYTSESDNPYQPFWEESKENIKFSGLNLDENLKLGELQDTKDYLTSSGAITFKSLAIFDNSKTIDDNQIAKSFIDEYFDLKQKN